MDVVGVTPFYPPYALPCADGKYDVSRQLEAAPTAFNAQRIESVQGDARLLDAA